MENHKVSALDLVYGQDIKQQINNSNILIIGVGGIGCELLKVLTNSGYRKMTILDLDTIEMTNLNRQFYFRREHVGMSKSLVGKESVMKKDQTLDITAIHGSIFDPAFDINFYRQFNFVFCALDNVSAREHLGRMCIMANRVMIDAGTGGYNGQVNVCKKNFSQCNNCQPSGPPTTFATCTIRATPSEPIHSVVFAMSLYNLLFGPPDPDNHLMGIMSPQDLFKSKNLDDLFNTGQQLFDFFFYDEIKKSIEGQTINLHKYPIKYQEAIQKEDILALPEQLQDLDRKNDTQKLYSIKYYAEQFLNSFVEIVNSPHIGQLKFEKDDQDCIQFVTSVAFFRTYNFTHKFKVDADPTLLLKDKFKYLPQYDVKVMGGKVIPAIASTNAIAAAVQVLECQKLFQNDLESLKYVWITQSDKRLDPTFLKKPLYTCKTCAPNIIYIYVQTNFDTTILEEFQQKILQKLGLMDKTIQITGTASTIFDLNDPDMCDNENNRKTLLRVYSKDQNSIGFTIFEDNQYKQKVDYWKFAIQFQFFIFHNDRPLDFDQETTLQQVKEIKKNWILKKTQMIREERNNLYKLYD